MTTKIVNNLNPTDARVQVEAGQIRMDDNKRVIMVIEVVGVSSSRLTIFKAMILQECHNGGGVPFRTIPKNYNKYSLDIDFPILLNGTITIGGE